MLEKILAQKRLEISRRRQEVPLAALEREARRQPLPQVLSRALKSRGGELNLLAELKAASPSRGLIRPLEGRVGERALLYERAGAQGLSVLTDEPFFQGKLEYLKEARQATRLPLLRKDFILDPYQIFEARAYGADAFLLIARLLEEEEMKEFLALARRLDMEALVEVHGEEEVERALSLGAALIGINNRDLATFTVDLNTTLRLKRLIPPDRVVVSASGIKKREDALLVKRAGVDAILVGEALMEAEDVEAKIRELRLLEG